MLEAKTYVGLDSLPGEYSRLFEEAGQESFFLTLPWFRNLDRTVLGRDEIVQIIGVASREPQMVPFGALVLKVNTRPNRFLSQSSIDSLTNYYTSYYAPVLARDCGRMEDVVNMLARELCSRNPLWDVLNIRPVDLFSAEIQHFHLALKDLGIQTQTYFCFGNWFLNVGGRSYSEYFRDLPSVIKKNVPYYRKRLEKIARTKIEIYTNSENLASGIRDYEAVYNSSWRDSEGYPNFIRGLIQTAAENGWLRLGVFYIDEEPAAAQLWIVHGGVASIYKICYAEKFAKLSVGSVLTARLLEHVLDVDRVTEVDYLSGDDTYKADWMSDRRERWGIMAFNPKTLWGRAGIIRHIVGRNLKVRWNSLTKEAVRSFW